MLIRLARVGPPEFVEVAPGAAPVAVDQTPNRCWGLTKGTNGISKHCKCDRRARPGRLTCWHHRRWEAAARALQRALNPEDVDAAR